MAGEQDSGQAPPQRQAQFPFQQELGTLEQRYGDVRVPLTTPTPESDGTQPGDRYHRPRNMPQIGQEAMAPPRVTPTREEQIVSQMQREQAIARYGQTGVDILDAASGLAMSEPMELTGLPSVRRAAEGFTEGIRSGDPQSPGWAQGWTNAGGAALGLVGPEMLGLRGGRLPPRTERSPFRFDAPPPEPSFTRVYRGINNEYDPARAGALGNRWWHTNPEVASTYAPGSEGAHVIPGEIDEGALNLAHIQAPPGTMFRAPPNGNPPLDPRVGQAPGDPPGVFSNAAAWDAPIPANPSIPQAPMGFNWELPTQPLSRSSAPDRIIPPDPRAGGPGGRLFRMSQVSELPWDESTGPPMLAARAANFGTESTIDPRAILWGGVAASGPVGYGTAQLIQANNDYPEAMRDPRVRALWTDQADADFAENMRQARTLQQLEAINQGDADAVWRMRNYANSDLPPGMLPRDESLIYVHGQPMRRGALSQ